MISPATEQKLAELFAVQDTYRPNAEISGQLASKTMLMFVGATCEGKNTVMDAVAKADPRFRSIGAFTSRPPRDGETDYTYYENTDEGLAPLLARIDRHEVVQYAVNMHAHLLYGSEITDYHAEYNMGDIFASAIANFRQLGFKQALTFTVITEPELWLQRFNKRFPLDHPQRQARRDEAIESFTWSLTQNHSDHYWIENIDGQPELAAQTVLDACLHGGAGQPKARSLAEASLETAKKIIL